MSKSPRQQHTVGPVDASVLADIARQIRLIWRLFFDPRVPLWVKTIPITALAYLIVPVDLVPELAFLGLGLLDDLGVVALGIATFINLCPREVVEEHLRAIEREAGRRAVPPDRSSHHRAGYDSTSSASTGRPPTPKVIDGSFTVKSDEGEDA